MDEKKILLDSIKSIRQQARVCEERRESYLLMFKKAIKKGNMDGVRINLENVIDMRDWQTTYLKCASRLDTLLAWFGIKAKMTTIDTMASNIKSLESTLATVAGNLQEMSETMDSFLNREVQAKFMVSYNAIKEGNKDLQRMSKSLQGQLIECKKEEKSEMLKVKKATEKGNMEGAQIYAENAIRKRTEQMNYLKLVSLLDVVMGQVDTLPMMGTISDSMALIEFLKSTLSTVAGNLQEMSETMVQFDKQFVNMESFMAGSTLLSTPEEGEVNSLIQQVADDYELQLFLGLPRPAALGVPVQVPEKVDVDDLSRRLAELKARQ